MGREGRRTGPGRKDRPVIRVEEFPDMVGTTTTVYCTRCGLVLDHSNDALEYSNGQVVDVR
jgi:hypothetical protein